MSAAVTRMAEISMRVQILRVTPKAHAPQYMSAGAAGADLYACIEEPLRIAPGATVPVPTGIALAIPEGYAGFVFARSGLAKNAGIAPANKVGVIDSDYRGEVVVNLHNHSSELYSVLPDARIAQIVFLACPAAVFEEVNELHDTVRGSGGFGSTGR